MERIKRARLKEFVILKADEWEGWMDSNPNRRGNHRLHTELPELATASHSRRLARSHSQASGRRGESSCSLASGGKEGPLGQPARLHTACSARCGLCTPSQPRAGRRDCPVWDGVVVWACGRVALGSWGLGSRARVVVEYPSEPWRTPWSVPLRSMMSRRQGCFAALNLSSGAVGV
jgi:hypothetical protein